jgi:hypothetical protein
MSVAVLTALFSSLLGSAVAKPRLFLLLVFLLAGIPTALITGNATFFAALGGLSGQAAYAFGLVIACLVILIIYIGRLPATLGRTPFLILFLLYCCASIAWADHLLDAIRMTVKVASPFLFFWAVVAIRPDARLARQLETCLYVTCTIACSLAVLHMFTGDLMGPHLQKAGPFGFVMLAAPYTSGANFSFLILTGATTAYCRWLRDRRLVHLLLALAFAFALLLSFVRITLAAALLCLAMIHMFRVRRAAVVLVVTLTIIAGALLMHSEAFMKRMFFNPDRVEWSQSITDFDRFAANIDTSGRLTLWTDAARAFADDSALLGAGMGAVDAWIQSGGSSGSELHSEVYRLYLETGWIGLALYSLGVLSLWRAVRAQWKAQVRRGEKASVPAQASALLLPAYCLTLLTDNTLNYASEFGVIVFGLAGITLATVRQRVADERNAPVMQEPNPLVSAS